jgi:hypothetical protein
MSEQVMFSAMSKRYIPSSLQCEEFKPRIEIVLYKNSQLLRASLSAMHPVTSKVAHAAIDMDFERSHITIKGTPWLFPLIKTWMADVENMYGERSKNYHLIMSDPLEFQEYVNELWMFGRWPIKRVASEKQFYKAVKRRPPELMPA